MYVALVVLDLIDVQQPGRWCLLRVLELSSGAGIDIGLGNDRKAGVYRSRLVDVKDKVRVLDQVDPETKREAVRGGGGRREGRGMSMVK